MILKKLELDSLRADLSAIESLLAARKEEEDPIGWFQLNSRKKHIEEQINRIEKTPAALASIGLFFGGDPVFGSKGILAEFAGKILEQFQELVQKRFAVADTGPLGARGPIRGKGDAQLMIVEVARGSFGFVLEEASENMALVETPLKQVLDEVSQLLINIASADEALFDQALESLDERTLISLKEFYKVLGENKATMKLVEQEKELLLGLEDITRARQRTEFIDINNSEHIKEGTLYILPHLKKFEMHLSDAQETISGNITTDCLKDISIDEKEISADTVAHSWRVSLDIKEITAKGRKLKKRYTLTKLIERKP